ncbi:hypothetical protein [Selenomonas sp. FC4001]|uniref:hypothetical protein n=1 Tax=Selenomonas sp. FC4001 TaxID=1408313 RepID=UPI00056ACA34|nr:hypothetical protein [Selenomonas sp. FC4001]
MSQKYMYLFPFEKVPKGCRIVIYGAGDVGQEYLEQLMASGYCKVLAFIDRSYAKYAPMIVPVYPVEKVLSLSFDFIVLAFKMGTHVRAVIKRLISFGVAAKKIIYIEPRKDVEVLTASNRPDREIMYDFAYLHDGISIALRYGTGLGDAIVKKKFFMELVAMAPNCRIDIYSPGASDMIEIVYRDQPNLNAVINDGGALYAKHKSRYSLAFSMLLFMLNVDAFNEEEIEDYNSEFAEKMMNFRQAVNKYNLSVMGVTSQYVHFQRMKLLGLNYYNYLNYTGVLNIKGHEVSIPLDPVYKKQYEHLALMGKYITINYGGGVEASNKNNGIAKDWPFEYVEKFVKLFKKKYPKIKIVQLGSAETVQINEVDKCFLGKNLELVKYILKESLLHVDKEGGLVHLATQLGTKCVVCFGPTSVDYFGYDENINILVGDCHGCYCLYDGFDVCAKGMEMPDCMWKITPEMVMKKVDEFLVVRGLS